MSATSRQASEASVQEALTTFRSIVPAADASKFNDTTLENVWDQVRALERSLADERRGHNFRKLQCLFDRLRCYADAAAVQRINRTALCWSWVSMIAMLGDETLIDLVQGSHRATLAGLFPPPGARMSAAVHY